MRMSIGYLEPLFDVDEDGHLHLLRMGTIKMTSISVKLQRMHNQCVTVLLLISRFVSDFDLMIQKKKEVGNIYAS